VSTDVRAAEATCIKHVDGSHSRNLVRRSKSTDDESKAPDAHIPRRDKALLPLRTATPFPRAGLSLRGRP
jgi:hypothetical protein